MPNDLLDNELRGLNPAGLGDFLAIAPPINGRLGICAGCRPESVSRTGVTLPACMTTSASAVLFPATGQVELIHEFLDDAALPADRVLIRSEASAISAGTELATLYNTLENVRYPIRPGYGAVGRVIKACEGSELKPGQRVYFAGRHASAQLFQQDQNHQWGICYPVPESIDPLDAAFGALAEIAMTSLDVSPVTAGDTVAVFGLGLIGLLAASLFTAAGARVIGLDPIPQRCQLARRLGIATALDVSPALQVSEIKRETGGRGADICVDATGHSGVILSAMLATRRFGQVTLLGTPRARFSADMTPAFLWVHEQGITVRGSHVHRLPARDLPETAGSAARNYGKVFAMMANGTLNIRAMISHVIRPADISDTYKKLQASPQDYAGVVIDWR